MKTSVPILILCATMRCGLPAQTSEPNAPDTAQNEKDIYPRGSVVGEWNFTHPYWTDVLTFREDGTFHTKSAETSGRWVLTADKGTPLLVLRWERYGTESLLMVNQGHFRGQVQPGSFMDMRRGEKASE